MCSTNTPMSIVDYHLINSLGTPHLFDNPSMEFISLWIAVYSILMTRLANTLFHGKHFHFHPSMDSIFWQCKGNEKKKKNHCYSTFPCYISIIFLHRGQDGKSLLTYLGAIESMEWWKSGMKFWSDGSCQTYPYIFYYKQTGP